MNHRDKAEEVIKMKDIRTVLVVAVVLCVKLSSEAADVLQCTGQRRSDGQFFFNISYEVKDSGDCETQWLVDEKLAGYCDAEENMFESPIISATRNMAMLLLCPEKLECLIICPRASIHKKKQCSCEATSPTTLSKVKWSIGIWIGISVCAVLVIIIVIVTIVLYWKRQKTGYAISRRGPDDEVPV